MKFLALFILSFFALPLTFFQISSAAEAPGGFVFHKVKVGDTFAKIAPPEHWDIIKRVNRIDGAHLKIGKEIFIPSDLETAKKFLPVPKYLKELAESARAIHVFLERQYFGAYQNGQLVFWGPISSGKKEGMTPKGSFKVLSKSKFYRSKKYKMDMPFALKITDSGYFLHAQSLPGHPASHGCIRLLKEDAEKIFNWIIKNDPIILAKTVPKFGTVFLTPAIFQLILLT